VREAPVWAARGVSGSTSPAWVMRGVSYSCSPAQATQEARREQFLPSTRWWLGILFDFREDDAISFGLLKISTGLTIISFGFRIFFSKI
jgi:hypothetical protein